MKTRIDLLIIVQVIILLIGLISCSNKTTENNNERVTTPTFSLSGGVYYTSQTVSISCATANASIYYSTDGTDPTDASALYTGPIAITAVTTLKAVAYKSNYQPSAINSAVYVIEPFNGVAEPTLYPATGTYSYGQLVRMSCATNGAKIYYTTDGSEPSQSSTLYTAPIALTSSTTIKAKAILAGLGSSSTITSVYVINNLQTVSTPIFSVSGGSYTTAQSVTITCVTSGAEIHYTTNGAEPDQSSQLYTNPIIINSSLTLKAKAYTTGWNPSLTQSAQYLINLVSSVATPTFTLQTGVYNVTQSLGIVCSTNGAEIRYTTDGSEPNANSSIYSSPLTINSTTQVKARAYKLGMTASSVSSVTITISVVHVATPQFSPLGGIYISEQVVNIYCSNPEAQVYYTTDGSNPTQNSELYTGPLTINLTTVIKAIAYKTGLSPSVVATATYTIQVATPEFSLPAGVYHVPQSISIACSTVGAQVRYTTNGSDPTINSTLYSVPISVNATTQLKAKAFKTGMTPSTVASATYTIDILQVATPKISVPSGTYYSVQSVSITCSTDGAQIYYTVDGTEPTSNSLPYSASITISTNMQLKTIAFKTNMTQSQISTAIYTIILPPGNMIFVPGGTYIIGSSGYVDETPHNVQLSAFSIAQYEVSQTEWQNVMGNNPSFFTGNSNRPVENVNWYAALAYCNKRSILEGLPPCYTYSGYGENPDDWPVGWNLGTHNNFTCNFNVSGYRLPTEAEWEYAARGATNNPEAADSLYAGSSNINTVAWYLTNSDYMTHVRGQKISNTLGLFDMSGNVYEWCWDWYDQYPIPPTPITVYVDPVGPLSGTDRICRGGSWNSASVFCQVRYRSSFDPSSNYYNIGLRVCRSMPNRRHKK